MMMERMTRSLKRSRSGPSAAVANRIAILALVFVALVSSSTVQAWSPHNHKSFVSTRPNINNNNKYLSPATPSSSPQSPHGSQKTPLTSQKMLKFSGTLATNNRQKVQLSQSVLASCDTLPSFPTAHGLLSPETVMQLQELEHQDHAVSAFLTSYRRHGPLSCVPMLGDPNLLPHLTRAMRKIAQ